MNFVEFLKDKLFNIILSIFSYISLALIFKLAKISNMIIILFFIVLTILSIVILLYEYLKRRKFYKELFTNVERLDKAYLVLPILPKPSFYDGKMLYDILYEINKSMIENVGKLEEQNEDFKEYIEMWIHEIKIPIASLTLIAHNNKDKFDNKTLEQINRINNYIEQILYYSRSENAEKDYMINKVNLAKAINNVALKNKDDLLNCNIELQVKDTDFEVTTDLKWLEFILNQIFNNSIKYKREINDSYIKLYAEKNDNIIKLFIEDNGIGIPDEDINYVFDKTFTGYNGRIKSKSTGMGLYIASRLCNKLGHEISIESKQNEFTRICIAFKNNDYYNVVS